MAGEACFAPESVDAGCLGEQLGGGQRTAAVKLEQLRGLLANERGDLTFELGALADELSQASQQ